MKVKTEETSPVLHTQLFDDTFVIQCIRPTGEPAGFCAVNGAAARDVLVEPLLPLSTHFLSARSFRICSTIASAKDGFHAGGI